MSEVGYVTAKNLFQPEETEAHPQLTPDLLRDAGANLTEIRKSVQAILDSALAGAQDLQKGEVWSQNIDMFESLSMDQARTLALLPIGSNHPRFGPRIFQARAAFVAFRESVRQEIIGKVRPELPSDAYEAALMLVREYARQAIENMLAVEKALAEAAP